MKKKSDNKIEAYKAKYMVERRIRGFGRQIRISSETAQMIIKIIHLTGDEKTTMGGFVENILQDHIETHADTLNAMLADIPGVIIPKQ